MKKDRIEDGQIPMHTPFPEHIPTEIVITDGAREANRELYRYKGTLHLVKGELAISTRIKPNIFHLFMMKVLLGWEWEDNNEN